MFLIIFFILVIVSGLSFAAGSKENYQKTHNDKTKSLEAPLAGSNDKGTMK